MKKVFAMVLALAMVMACATCGAFAEAPDTSWIPEGVGGYKIGFFYLPESDLQSLHYHNALRWLAELTNCEMEFYDMTSFGAEDLAAAVENLVSVGCDGIILVGGTSPSMFEYMNDNHVYYAGMTRSHTEEVAKVADPSEYCVGWIDESSGTNYNMGYDVCAGLGKAGCKNIAYVASAIGEEIDDDRVAGFEDAAKDYGMNIVTSYRGSDFATGFSDILSTFGPELDGIASNSSRDVGIAAIQAAGYIGQIKYAQVNNPGPDTVEYMDAGFLVGTSAGNNTFIVEMYMQLFNALSGADRLFNEGEKIVPMISSFAVTTAEEWAYAEKYVMGVVPGMTPDEVLSLNSLYAPDTTKEEKEELLKYYASPEFWNITDIAARVGAYLGE